MIRALRKLIIWRRIQWAEWDVQYWTSARNTAEFNLRAAERRLRWLNARPNEIDFKLPRGVRAKS